MTYDVLEKVTKKQLIAWIRKNVFLPRNISDEQFLRDVKLQELMDRQEQMLRRDEELTQELEAAKGQPVAFMKILVESQKHSEEMQKVSDQIDRLLGIGGADHG